MRQCALGEITFEEFSDKYNNHWNFYALDGHESDEEERESLERYEDKIELHRAIAFDVLGPLCSEEDAIKAIYVQAGRFGAAVAVQKLVSLWKQYQNDRGGLQITAIK